MSAWDRSHDSTAKRNLSIFPLTAIKDMWIKDMGIFNGTFSHNGNGKKYDYQQGNFIDELGPCLLPKFAKSEDS